MNFAADNPMAPAQVIGSPPGRLPVLEDLECPSPLLAKLEDSLSIDSPRNLSLRRGEDASRASAYTDPQEGVIRGSLCASRDVATHEAWKYLLSLQYNAIHFATCYIECRDSAVVQLTRFHSWYMQGSLHAMRVYIQHRYFLHVSGTSV